MSEALKPFVRFSRWAFPGWELPGFLIWFSVVVTAFVAYDATVGPLGRIAVGIVAGFAWLALLRAAAAYIKYRRSP